MGPCDYCYTVFTDGVGYLNAFRSPQEYDTAWGPAVRSEEIGRLIWSDDLYIKESSAHFLIKWLPEDRRSINYTKLDISGSYFDRVNAWRGREIAGTNPDLPASLFEMLTYVWSQSTTWALFVQAYCEDIGPVLCLTNDDAIDALNRFMFEDSPELDGGFCIVSA
jgi:hypothetical protein